MAFFKNIMVFSIFGLILIPSILSGNAEMLSPRQQMESGIDAEDVECKSGLVLMIRSTNGAAACVKSPTSLKLVNTGWGTIIKTMNESESKEEIPNMQDDKQPESSEETDANIIEIKIKDGVGSGDR
ncbi:MAG TPA: hypothetical protein VD731_01075 [Nitrosopumilaceae archaeon]|nr:hypothetical protein [Nitrosopumilaceae archaeon]